MRGLHLRVGLQFMQNILAHRKIYSRENPIPDDSKGAKTMEEKDQVQLV